MILDTADRREVTGKKVKPCVQSTRLSQKPQGLSRSALNSGFFNTNRLLRITTPPPLDGMLVPRRVNPPLFRLDSLTVTCSWYLFTNLGSYVSCLRKQRYTMQRPISLKPPTLWSRNRQIKSSTLWPLHVHYPASKGRSQVVINCNTYN